MSDKRFATLLAAVFALGLTSQGVFAAEPNAGESDKGKPAKELVAAKKDKGSVRTAPERYSFWSTKKSARQETKSEMRQSVRESNQENRIFKESGAARQAPGGR